MDPGFCRDDENGDFLMRVDVSAYFEFNAAVARSMRWR